MTGVISAPRMSPRMNMPSPTNCGSSAATLLPVAKEFGSSLRRIAPRQRSFCLRSISLQVGRRRRAPRWRSSAPSRRTEAGNDAAATGHLPQKQVTSRRSKNVVPVPPICAKWCKEGEQNGANRFAAVCCNLPILRVLRRLRQDLVNLVSRLEGRRSVP